MNTEVQQEKSPKLYISVVQYQQVNKETKKPFLYEEVHITNECKKKFLTDASVIVEVTELKMIKDRFVQPNETRNEFEIALQYIELLAQRNSDVNKIWQSFVTFAEEKQNNK